LIIKEIPGVKSTFQKELTYSQTFSFFGKTLKGTEIKMQWIFNVPLSEANVAIVTGDAFEILTVSVSHATSDEILKEALKRIKDALAL
jgi:aspartate aminotransferase